MLKRLCFILITSLAAPADAATLRLWRLDCGVFVTKQLSNGCYLLQHGQQYMLWDAGLGAEIVGHPKGQGLRTWIELSATVVDQLKQLKIAPRDISILAVSHRHFDHIGQASTLPSARLFIGQEDWEAIKASPDSDDARTRFKPWLEGGTVTAVAGDADIFGDGSVMMLAMPGHTPGHHALLVRLAHMGPVLLTGDLWARAALYAEDSTDASQQRFKALAKDINATVIIQHEPADIAKLPTFPDSAD